MSVNKPEGTTPTVKKNAFVHKLYTMLNDPDLTKLIWWTEDNSEQNSFSLLPGKEFSHALTNYFKHGNVASFVRQLHMYGFHKVNDNNTDNSVWEFKHSTGKFKKDDEEGLVHIKRRSSSNNNPRSHPQNSPPIGHSGHGMPPHIPQPRVPQGHPQFAPPPPPPSYHHPGHPGHPGHLAHPSDVNVIYPHPMNAYYYNEYMAPVQYIPYGYPPHQPPHPAHQLPHPHHPHQAPSMGQPIQIAARDQIHTPPPPPGHNPPVHHGPSHQPISQPQIPLPSMPSHIPVPITRPASHPTQPIHPQSSTPNDNNHGDSDPNSYRGGDRGNDDPKSVSAPEPLLLPADEQKSRDSNQMSPSTQKQVLEPVPQRPSSSPHDATIPPAVYSHRPSNTSPHTIIKPPGAPESVPPILPIPSSQSSSYFNSPNPISNVNTMGPSNFNFGRSTASPISMIHRPSNTSPTSVVHRPSSTSPTAVIKQSPQSSSSPSFPSGPNGHQHQNVDEKLPNKSGVQQYRPLQFRKIWDTSSQSTRQRNPSLLFDPLAPVPASSGTGITNNTTSTTTSGSTTSLPAPIPIDGRSSVSGRANESNNNSITSMAAPSTISGISIPGNQSLVNNSRSNSRSQSKDFPRSLPNQSSITERFRPSLIEMYKFHDSISTNNSIFSNNSSMSSISSQRDNSIGSVERNSVTTSDIHHSIMGKSLTPPIPKQKHSPILRCASSNNSPVHKVSIKSLLEGNDDLKRRKVSDTDVTDVDESRSSVQVSVDQHNETTN